MPPVLAFALGVLLGLAIGVGVMLFRVMISTEEAKRAWVTTRTTSGALDRARAALAESETALEAIDRLLARREALDWVCPREDKIALLLAVAQQCDPGGTVAQTLMARKVTPVR